MRVAHFFAFATVLALLPACGTGTGGQGGETTTTTGGVCAALDAGADTYAAGLSRVSADGQVKVAFVSAQPAPPAKGANDFVIDVTDASGQPLTGASIALEAFMPAHGHGATAVPAVQPGSQPGRYTMTGLGLFMAGTWQITFTVTPTGGTAEPVMFTFCVEG